jgi:hypothetical protein
MFIQFAVFLASIALAFVVIMIIRQRSETISCQNNQEELLNEATNCPKPIGELTLPELEQILIKLEEHRNSVSAGFLHMDSIQKNKTMAQVSKINEKIKKVKLEIEEHYQYH